MTDQQQDCRKNTDREIWRGKSRAEFDDPDRFYADSLFIPAGDVEALGIICDGFTIVKSIRDWHRLAAELLSPPDAPKEPLKWKSYAP